MTTLRTSFDGCELFRRNDEKEGIIRCPAEAV